MNFQLKLKKEDKNLHRNIDVYVLACEFYLDFAGRESPR